VTALTCVFCDIVRGTEPASIVYADESAVAFMDIQPVNPGHLLVVPRAHARYLAEVEPEMAPHLFRVGVMLAGALRRSGIRCDGINLLLADGEAAGQEVYHVHLHVIPRIWGDGFGFRFGPGYRQRPNRATLDDAAATIRAALEA
jgi:histidine triad (HIT) family protein